MCVCVCGLASHSNRCVRTPHTRSGYCDIYVIYKKGVREMQPDWEAVQGECNCSYQEWQRKHDTYVVVIVSLSPRRIWQKDLTWLLKWRGSCIQWSSCTSGTTKTDLLVERGRCQSRVKRMMGKNQPRCRGSKRQLEMEEEEDVGQLRDKTNVPEVLAKAKAAKVSHLLWSYWEGTEAKAGVVISLLLKVDTYLSLIYRTNHNHWLKSLKWMMTC